MTMCSPFSYKLICFFARIGLRICHPLMSIKGRENFPEGATMMCCNHSALTDPIWVIAFAKRKRHPRSMAKKELFGNKLFAWFFTKLGAFPVDRSGSDITAVKTAMQTLRDDNKLLIFPEGTRIRKGKKSEPHSGAILIAARMKSPVMPIYLSTKKGLFRRVKLIFGEPYYPEFAGAKPTSEELELRTTELMEKIYALGEWA